MSPSFAPDNRLFALARTAQRATSVPVAIALALGLIVLMIATQVAARVILRSIFGAQSGSIADPIAEAIGFLSIYVGLWIWLRYYSRRPLSSLGFEQGNAARCVLRGATVAVLMFAATALIVIKFGASIAPGSLY